MQNEEILQPLPTVLPPRFQVEVPSYASADPLPDVPIMPSTRLQLELLLQEPVLDLRAVSEVILEDMGATLQILRLVGEEYAVEAERPIRIEDCIASLNTEMWFEAVCASTLIQNSRVQSAWQHAKRIGRYAEQLAAQEESLRPGEGHLVGLLHEVGRLPELLGWQSAGIEMEDQTLGALLAQHWHLPNCVLAATREQEQAQEADQEPAQEAAQGQEPSLWTSLLKAAHACALLEDEQGSAPRDLDPSLA